MYFVLSNISQLVKNQLVCFLSVLKQFAVLAVGTAQLPGYHTFFKSKSDSEVRDGFVGSI
jgi:hypothetical protein